MDLPIVVTFVTLALISTTPAADCQMQEKSGNTAESFKSEGLDKTLPAIEFPVSANLDTVLPESWISGNSVSDMLPDNSSNSESIFINASSSNGDVADGSCRQEKAIWFATRRREQSSSYGYHSNHHNHPRRPGIRNPFKNLSKYFLPQPKKSQQEDAQSADSDANSVNANKYNGGDDGNNSGNGGYGNNAGYSNGENNGSEDNKGATGNGSADNSDNYNRYNGSNSTSSSNNNNNYNDNNKSNSTATNPSNSPNQSERKKPTLYELLLSGATGPTGFVVFMVVAVVIAVAAGGIVSLATSGGRQQSRSLVDTLTSDIYDAIQSYDLIQESSKD